MKLHHGACLAGALLLVAPSATLDAQSLQRVPSRGRTLGDMVRRMPKPDGEVRRKVINLDSASDSFIFAAAGSVQGAGGTFFRSDVTITNFRNVTQLIGVAFVAQGVDNSNAPIIEFQLPPNTPTVARDFVGSGGLHETGLGSIVVFGEKPNGDLDPDAMLDGFSRIWTPQPGSAGSVSQGFPSVAFLDSFGSAAAYAQGLRHDNSFRTNAGIVNLDDVSHTWNVDVNGTGGRTSFTMTVLPFSMRQQVVPNGNWSDLVLAFQTTGTGFWWSAYGAAVDNVTGDSWSAHAAQP